MYERQIGIPKPRYSMDNYEVPVQMPWRPMSETKVTVLRRATIAAAHKPIKLSKIKKASAKP